MKKKIAFLLAALMLLSLALSACGNSTPAPVSGTPTPTQSAPVDPKTEKVTLRISYNWTGSDPQAPYFEGMLKKFAEANKDSIELVMEGTPGEDHRSKIKVDASTGNLADVMTYWPGNANLKPLVEGNELLDIGEYLKVSTATKKENFPDSFWDFYKINGTYYGIPVSSFKGFFLANKSLFDKYSLSIPKTWDEFMAVSKTFIDNGIIPFSMGSKGGQPSHLYISFLAYNFENGYEENSKMLESWNFNTPSNVKAAKAIDEMRQNKIFPSDTVSNGEWGPSLALYNEEKAAMIYEFPWMAGHVKPDIAEKSEFFDMPAYQGDTSKTSGYTIGASNMGYIVSKKSFEDPAKQAAIVKLLDFITSDEMFSELAKGGMPPAKNVTIDSSTLDPFFARVLEYTKNQTALSQHENFFPDPCGLSTMFEGLDELFAGAITPEDFINKVQAALDDAK